MCVYSIRRDSTGQPCHRHPPYASTSAVPMPLRLHIPPRLPREASTIRSPAGHSIGEEGRATGRLGLVIGDVSFPRAHPGKILLRAFLRKPPCSGPRREKQRARCARASTEAGGLCAHVRLTHVMSRRGGRVVDFTGCPPELVRDVHGFERGPVRRRQAGARPRFAWRGTAAATSRCTYVCYV